MTNIIPQADQSQGYWVKTILIICLTAIYSLSNAQILHADQFLVIPKNGKTFSGRIALDGLLRQDVNQLIQVGNQIELRVLRKKGMWTYSQSFSWAQTQNGTLFNGGYAQVRRNPLPSKTWGIEEFAQAQYDGIRGMEERLLMGTNLRWLSQKDSLKFQFGTGFFLEHEVWSHPETGEIRPLRLKWNNYLRMVRIWSQGQELSGMLYLQTRPDATISKPRLSGQARFSFPLSKKLSFEVQADVSYDAAPVVPINPLTYVVRQKLAYQF